MKRWLYILILSATTVLIITVIDIFFSQEEPRQDQPVIDDLAIDLDEDAGNADPDETAAWNVEYPLFEDRLDDEGKPIRVQTAQFVIELLTRVEGNEFEARNITFEFYDKARYKKPNKERIAATGRADRAKLYSEGESELGGMDLKFKPEFILKDNVLINTFNPDNGAPSFSMKANDLIFKDNLFTSTEAVTIFKQGMSIFGYGLECDLKESYFTLHERIRIEGTDFDFSNLGEAMPAGATPVAKSVEPPAAVQDDVEAGAAALTITAKGPLQLYLVGNEETGGSDAFGSLQPEAEEKPVNKLKIYGDVKVKKEDLDFTADELFLDFDENAGGDFEVHSLKGFSKGNRTAINLQGYKTLCDDFTYSRKDGKGIFRIKGDPEISNVSVPLFSALSETTPDTGNKTSGKKEPAVEGGREKLAKSDVPEKAERNASEGEKRAGKGDQPEGSLLSFRCRDLMVIDYADIPNHAPKDFNVELSGQVSIIDINKPEPHMLDADTLSFSIHVEDRNKPATNATRDAGEAEAFNINDFLAQGRVSGRIDRFDLACSELKYGYITSQEGNISELRLKDEKESRLMSDDFSLFSPHILIAMRPGITEITSTEVFHCLSKLENLPPMTSFDLFSAESPERDEKTPVAEPSPGTIVMDGSGDFRLLSQNMDGASRQNVIIKESNDFEMHMFREGESIDNTVLTIKGNRTFSLEVAGGQLSSLHLDHGGELFCSELGFTTHGDSLHLVRQDENTLQFLTEGANGTGYVSFLQPERADSPDAAGGNDPDTTRADSPNSAGGKGSDTPRGNPPEAEDGGHPDMAQGEKREPCNIWADKIRILTGGFSQLTAENNVTADIPFSLFANSDAKGKPAMEGQRGTYRVRSDALRIDRPEGADNFVLSGRGDVRIRNEEAGVNALCETFLYNSIGEVLTMCGQEGKDAEIRLRSRYDEKIYDSIFSNKIDINVRNSHLQIHDGGIVNLSHYNADRNSLGRIHIDCDKEIVLQDELLRFNGPVRLEYSTGLERSVESDRQGKSDRQGESKREGESARDGESEPPGELGGEPRRMTCRRLYVYFEKSPLKATTPAFDMETYKNRIREGLALPAPDAEQNMIRMIRAQEDVVLSFKTHSIASALMTWNIIKDEILCDGLGKPVRIVMDKQAQIQGRQMIFKPVTEEVTVIRR